MRRVAILIAQHPQLKPRSCQVLLKSIFSTVTVLVEKSQHTKHIPELTLNSLDRPQKESTLTHIHSPEKLQSHLKSRESMNSAWCKAGKQEYASTMKSSLMPLKETTAKATISLEWDLLKSQPRLTCKQDVRCLLKLNSPVKAPYLCSDAESDSNQSWKETYSKKLKIWQQNQMLPL